MRSNFAGNFDEQKLWKESKSVFEELVISKTAQGVCPEATLNNYEYALRSIGKHLNIEKTFEEITKRVIKN